MKVVIKCDTFNFVRLQVCQAVKLNLHSCRHLCHSFILTAVSEAEQHHSPVLFSFIVICSILECASAKSLGGDTVW
jgi:hypothetical protein